MSYPILTSSLEPLHGFASSFLLIFLKPGANESKNAKQMRNTKQNCLSYSSATPRNDKQCSAKQCFANQTNRSLAGFEYRSDPFRDNAHG